MSLNADIRDQAYQFFIAEAQELLLVLETGLLDLHQDHSIPNVHKLMHAVHSIKGGAASVELSAIEFLAHRLEDFFKVLYSDDIEFDQELEELLLQGYDCLAKPLRKQIEQGIYDEEKALLTAEPVFAALELHLADALENSNNYIPSANDLGIDLVSSIFEVDVVQALEQLKIIVDNPHGYELEEELQERLDMFAGFAELFSLSGLGEIVETAKIALGSNRDRTLDIMRATIADCTKGKDLVLAGDRQQGGTVSDTLRELAQSNNDLSNTQIAETRSESCPSEQDCIWSAPIICDSASEVFFDAVPKSLSLPNNKNKAKAKSNLPVSESAKSPGDKTKAVPKLSVRVDLERLERMNNLVGELIIDRNSLSRQNEQLQVNVSELRQKFVRFREVTQKLREVSDRLVLEQRSSGLSSTNKSVASSSYTADSINDFANESAEFDALGMDSYGELYSALQEILEETLQLEESVDDITIFAQQSDHTINDQRQKLSQMRDELIWVRMLPLDQILQRFPRTLRDLSTKYRKPVDLKLNGTGVFVDKAVLEKLADPLLQLVRNGFDHGIESSEIRAKEGKPKNGLIEIKAYYRGNQTVIEVKDDGQGLDLTKIANQAIEQGLMTAQEVSIANESRLFDLIFEPGFSTASQVSEISGRGVGMNIVRSQIETLKGKIIVDSIPGKGSTFTLCLPLTLTIAKLLICSLGKNAFAIPSASIEEIIIPTETQIKFANSQKFLLFNDKLVPVYSLKETLLSNCPYPVSDWDSTSQAFKTIAAPEDWLPPLLILSREQQLFALEVTSLLSEQELMIKPYSKASIAPSYTYGYAVLANGSLIPVFDDVALISTVLGEEIRSVVSAPNFINELEESDLQRENLQDTRTDKSSQEEEVNDQRNILNTIMIIDDSTALRQTMAFSLEKHGFKVIQKQNGKDGLDGFKDNSDIDLIICDVEMPTMNGFEFLGMRRRDPVFSQIPTFMLTSRSGAKHRSLAEQLGANGYFTKPYIEQHFIAEIKKILKANSSVIRSSS